MFHKILAFIKRDFLIQLSYKFNFILIWFNIFGFLLIFYFIAKSFGGETSPYFTEYGGKYFPFVFIGVALSGCLAMSIVTLSRNMRAEQITGTLEAVLATPIRLRTLIISMSMCNLLYTLTSVIVFLLFGKYFFGIGLISANFISTITIFFLIVIFFNCIGLLASSFIIVFKRGEPISWLISIFSSFLGGAYFPIDVLPKYLKNISQVLPTTYALRALRKALLKGDDLKVLLPDIFILSAFCITLLPLSIAIFKFAVKKAKIAGSLTHY